MRYAFACAKVFCDAKGGNTGKRAMQNRREFLKVGAAGLALAAARRSSAEKGVSTFPPVRTITRGPKHHWFGYYDKLQFDPSGRFVLGMEVDFEHRYLERFGEGGTAAQLPSACPYSLQEVIGDWWPAERRPDVDSGT